LGQLIEAGASWVDIGRRFGVSDVAAKKWAKKHQLV
jgi:transposase-like protein